MSKMNFRQDFEAKVWSSCRNCSLVNILRLRFGGNEAKFWSRFWRWSLIRLLKLKFGRDSEAEFWCYAVMLPLCFWQCLYLVMHASNFYFCTFSSWQQYNNASKALRSPGLGHVITNHLQCIDQLFGQGYMESYCRNRLLLFIN